MVQSSSNIRAESSRDRQSSTIGARESLRPKDEKLINKLPSPTKSLKNIFKNRESSYSVESIGEDRVLYATDSAASRSELSLTKTKSISGAISSFLKPMTRSKSSFTSYVSADDGIQRQKYVFTTNPMASKTADFADSSSDAYNSKEDYDADSINSILHEYQGTDSMYYHPDDKKQFLFKEDFDESSTSNESKNSREKSLRSINNRSPIRRNNTGSIIEMTLGGISGNSDIIPNSSRSTFYDNITNGSSNGKSNSNSNSNSDGSNPRFTIYFDKQIAMQPKQEIKRKVDRRKIMSTSSNVEVFNRSSLSNLTTVSDIESFGHDENSYPNTSSNMQKKRGSDNNFSFNLSKNILESDEEIIRNTNISSNIREANISEKAIVPNITERDSPARYSIGNSIYMDETAIKSDSNEKNTFRSSISTGELLNKLETYYDNDDDTNTNTNTNTNNSNNNNNNNNNDNNNNNTQTRKPYPILNTQNSKKNVERNLTAGIDSNADLPVILYKVHDKDFNTNRWSTISDKETDSNEKPNYPHLVGDDNISPDIYSTANNSSIASLPEAKVSHTQSNHTSIAIQSPPVSSSKSMSTSPVIQYINKNLNEEHIGDFRNDKPRYVKIKQSYGSIDKPPANYQLQDTISKQNSHTQMLKDSPSNYMAINSSFDDLEKQGRKSKNHENIANTHSWLVFALFMLLGLIIPPIFILITAGFFDNNIVANHNGYYNSQSTYLTVNPNQKKRFSKTQKIISFMLGLAWLAIVLAMIGVGIGVGISREH